MTLIKILKDKNKKIPDWLTSSLSIPNFGKNLEMGPYFDFIRNKLNFVYEKRNKNNIKLGE